jgi:hypothetical protein
MDQIVAQNLKRVILVLAEQRDIVAASGSSLASHLIDLAILQLRMTIHNISDKELSELSDLLKKNLTDGKRKRT